MFNKLNIILESMSYTRRTIHFALVEMKRTNPPQNDKCSTKTFFFEGLGRGFLVASISAKYYTPKMTSNCIDLTDSDDIEGIS